MESNRISSCTGEHLWHSLLHLTCVKKSFYIVEKGARERGRDKKRLRVTLERTKELKQLYHTENKQIFKHFSDRAKVLLNSWICNFMEMNAVSVRTLSSHREYYSTVSFYFSIVLICPRAFSTVRASSLSPPFLSRSQCEGFMRGFTSIEYYIWSMYICIFISL